MFGRVTYARRHCKARASLFTSLTFCKVTAVALWDWTREYICIHSSVFHLLESFAMRVSIYLFLKHWKVELKKRKWDLPDQSLSIFKSSFGFVLSHLRSWHQVQDHVKCQTNNFTYFGTHSIRLLLYYAPWSWNNVNFLI